MKSLANSYAAELYRHRRMWVAWPPDEHIPVGSFGYVDGQVYAPQGQLADLDIDFQATSSPVTSSEIYASAGTVLSQGGLEVDLPVVPLQPGVNFEVRFERQHGVFVLLTRCRTVRLENLLEVAKAVQAFKARREWDDRWHLVTAVRAAASGAIAVSADRDAKATLELTAEFPGTEGAVGLRFTRSKALGLQIVSDGLLTPFLELRRADERAPVPVMRGEGTSRVATPRIGLVEVLPDDPAPE